MAKPPRMPAEIAILLPFVSKLIGAGLSAWKARQSDGLDADDAAAVQAFLDVGGAIPDLLRKAPSGETAAAKHFELIVRSFGEAFRRHWYGDPHLAPKGGLWARLRESEAGEKRRKQLERRTKLATSRLLQPGDLPAGEDLRIVTALIGDPMITPYYRALWSAYTAPREDDEPQDDEPLIMPGEGYRQFERHFRLAYAEGLASPAGESIRRFLIGLGEDRTNLVRELLLRDMASWGGRHVFGVAGQQSDLPVMPLSVMYVQPFAEQEVKQEVKLRRPVLELLNQLVDEGTHGVVVVKANFGHGKSLSARTLAWRLAEQRFLSRTPAPQQPLPLFIKCSEDFMVPGESLDHVLRRAAWRHARDLGLGLSLDDPALQPPPKEWRSIILIDGLDEVSLGARELEHIFRIIREKASSTWKFIVFSRPEALPSQEDLKGIPVLDLQPFTTLDDDGTPGGQVGTWIERWNSVRESPSAMTAKRLQERDLLDIASTPILLFMIATVWKSIEEKEGRIPRAEIYEKFFAHIARGKHEADADNHPQIKKASDQLCQVLRKRGHIPEAAQPTDAMLWMLSRVAWEARRIEDNDMDEDHSERALDRRDISRIFDELVIRETSDMQRVIEVGVLLALQADLAEGRSRILFGHKSFQEFLVARYWNHQLRRLIDAEESDRENIEETLYGANLLVSEDQSFNFLVEILDMWTPDEKARLFSWAERCFNNERPQHGAKSYRVDQRPRLRLAALAIGSAVATERGIRAKDRLTLRTVLGWFWCRSALDGRVRARRLVSAGANLWDAYLWNADFEGAYLAEAQLVGAKLGGTNLRGANLQSANLMSASLNDANLTDADLNRADLSYANLHRANMTSANMTGADLTDTHLHRVNMTGANMTGANMTGANLFRVNMTGADMTGADLSDANLARANLSHALLDGANLSEADLTRTDLSEARLRGANLSGARVSQDQRAYLTHALPPDMLALLVWVVDPEEEPDPDEASDH
jgi:uncharacterized protein YjbI with pentapeptide repeats